MRASVCWARRGDQDHPKGRRREPNVREPAERVKQPCTECGSRRDQKKFDTSSLVKYRVEASGKSRRAESCGSEKRGGLGQSLFIARRSRSRRAVPGLLAVTKAGAAGCGGSGKSKPEQANVCSITSASGEFRGGAGRRGWRGRVRGRPKERQSSSGTDTLPTGPSPCRRLAGVGGTRRREGGDIESGGRVPRRSRAERTGGRRSGTP